MKPRLLSLLLGILAVLTVLGSCTSKPGEISTEETHGSTEPQSFASSDLPDTPELTPGDDGTEDEMQKLGEPDRTYTCGDASRLSSYNGKSAENYHALYRYFLGIGYEVYCSSERNGSLFCTLTNGSRLISMYWLKERNELNMVTSGTAATNLPPVTPSVTTGNYETSVVQLQQTAHVNGMGYIIQLADGSFIIYDGGYNNMTTPLYEKMVELNGSPENIVIRAWLLTHSHADHYPAFSKFASIYADQVTLEYLLIAPVAREDAEDRYLNDTVLTDAAKFKDVKICTVHTGMTFRFCNLNMEILFSPEELYIDGKSDNFNNSSIVSRVYSENYSMLFLGDAASAVASFLTETYGTYLKSDMCQVSHHGVEDVPLSFYVKVEANILWYPCTQPLYDRTDRNGNVRRALERAAFTEEILIAGNDCYQRKWR